MRRSLCAIAFILVLSIAFSIPAFAASAPSVSARSAILIEATTGKVLFSRSAEVKMPMASTTKIMTAIVAIEESRDLSATVKVDPRAAGVEGSSIYLYAGEELTLESLLYALMLSSANDAAVAIAYAVCGSVEAFVDLMNEKAETLCLKSTHFVNPHGLHDDEHYTTAHDLATITAYALQNDTFRTIVSTKSKTISQIGGDCVRPLSNHNRMLSLYRGAIGVKTGFTKRAGRCLVSAAERDGLTLVAVTLDAPNDWNDHISMLDFGFDSYEMLSLDGFSCELPVISGEAGKVTVRSSEPMSALLSRERGKIAVCIELPRFVYADVRQGDVLGKIVYKCDGRIIASSPIVAQESVNKAHYRKSFIEWIVSLFGY